MSEELKPEAIVEETPAEEAVIETPPHEATAREQGWVSKEEWVAQGKEADDWRPAKEFIRVGELYKSIHELKRKDKQTEAQLTALQRHHAYVFEKAYQTALHDLKQEKRQAIRNEDFEHLEEVETRMEQLQAQHAREAVALQATQVAAQQTAAPIPEFDAFVDKNPWYLTDKTLRDEADAVGFVYINNGGGKDGLFAHVEKEMRRKFPEKFGVKKAAPNAVAGVNRTNKASKGEVSISDVPDHMKEVIRNFTQSTGMSEAEYIKQLKKIGAF